MVEYPGYRVGVVWKQSGKVSRIQEGSIQDTGGECPGYRVVEYPGYRVVKYPGYRLGVIWIE